MSYKVLLPQPILPEGYAYLRDHGFEVVDGRGFSWRPGRSPGPGWTR